MKDTVDRYQIQIAGTGITIYRNPRNDHSCEVTAKTGVRTWTTKRELEEAVSTLQSLINDLK